MFFNFVFHLNLALCYSTGTVHYSTKNVLRFFRIIGDQTAGSDMHAQAMDQLRQRLEEAESSLVRERDLNVSLREDALSERERQEEETRKLADSLRKSETEKATQKSMFVLVFTFRNIV